MAMHFLSIIALRLVLLYQDAAGSLVLHGSTALRHNQAGALVEQLAKPEDFAAVDEFALRMATMLVLFSTSDTCTLPDVALRLAKALPTFDFRDHLISRPSRYSSHHVVFLINLHFHFSIMNAKVCDILHICIDHRCNWVARLDTF